MIGSRISSTAKVKSINMIAIKIVIKAKLVGKVVIRKKLQM